MERERQRVRTTLKICGIVTATAIIVALAIPTAVGAAGSLVTLVDSDGPSEAQVDAGKLRVGDGDGNPNSLTVNGVVTGRESPTWDFKRFSTFVPSTQCAVLATPPAGKALVITSIVVNTYQNPTPGTADYVAFYLSPAGSCSTLVHNVNPGGIGTTNVDLGPGIIVPNGQTLRVYHSGDNQSEIYAYGYQIAASQVPAASAESETPATSPQQGER